MARQRHPTDLLAPYVDDTARGVRLTRPKRRALQQSLRRTPDEMLQDLAALLDETPAPGVKVDTRALRAALDEHRERRLLVAKLRDAADRMEDEALAKKAAAIVPALAAYRVLLALERVAEGAPFREGLEVLRAARRAARRGRTSEADAPVKRGARGAPARGRATSRGR